MFKKLAHKIEPSLPPFPAKELGYSTEKSTFTIEAAITYFSEFWSETGFWKFLDILMDQNFNKGDRLVDKDIKRVNKMVKLWLIPSKKFPSLLLTFQIDVAQPRYTHSIHQDVILDWCNHSPMNSTWICPSAHFYLRKERKPNLVQPSLLLLTFQSPPPTSTPIQCIKKCFQIDLIIIRYLFSLWFIAFPSIMGLHRDWIARRFLKIVSFLSFFLCLTGPS